MASYGAIAHMKRDLARPYEIALHYGMNGHFQKLVATHPATAALDDGAYHVEILDGRLTRPQVAHLRDAVALTHGARTLDDLDPAAKAIGNLVVSAGLQNTRNALATAAAASANYRPAAKTFFAEADAAPVIKASLAPAIPAASLVDTALAAIARALAVGAAVSLSDLAVVLAAGWGLYELMPDYDPRLIHEVKLFGHPEVVAVTDETQGKVAVTVPGPPGKPASVVIWKVEMPPPSPVVDMPMSPRVVDQRGRIMGIYYPHSNKTILLTEAGDKALQSAVEPGGDTAEPRDGELKVSTDKRNRGLPEELWTKGGYREAAIANDTPLKDAIERDKTSAKTDEEKLTEKDVGVHHVIPMQAVRDNPELFLDGEWRPDRLDNLRALPKDETAQEKIERTTGEKRPIHKGGHESWNSEVQEEIDNMEQAIGGKGLTRGDPGYREAVKKGLNDLLQRMRERLRHRDVVLNDEPHRGVA